MEDLQITIKNIEQSFNEELSEVKNFEELENIRLKYLSRNGILANIMENLKNLSLEEKKTLGPVLNKAKEKVNISFKNKKNKLEQEKELKDAERLATFDVTAYKHIDFKGSLHPYTKVTEQIEDIFMSMGYEIADGPEVENEYHNFENLNIPADHPARDMQDTFWLTIPHMLMRTHTSSVQIHTMLKRKPPIAIVVPGRCYRNEATDSSHDFMFMQTEGLLIDKNIALPNLFATVKTFLRFLFDKQDLNIRIRPSYFPFVEPGLEIDMTCPFCCEGCSICKKSNWIEICGAGLVHPNVLKACNINPAEYSGFAFGFGLTRLVMLKYGITDIRLLHSNKLDFLNQF